MNTWSLGYEKAKEKAKNVYSKIGRVQCPALNDELIAFTNAGFNHLMRKGRIPRTRNEQKRRFILIKYIENIIKNPKATILYERSETKVVKNVHGDKVLVQSIADFWTFMDTVDGCRIKVVIRQLQPQGSKHFLSVMGDDIKIRKSNKNKKSRHK
jgi:hypothetical protein